MKTVLALSHLFGQLLFFLYRKGWLEQQEAGRTLGGPIAILTCAFVSNCYYFASKLQVSAHGRKWESNMEALTIVNY